jgi:uncharacterized membrane protein (DUF373 family)
MLIAGILSVIILIIALLALFSIFDMTIGLIRQGLNDGSELVFADYSRIFARMITLLISLEFMNSVLKILKSRSIKVLASDVVLITVLAVCRKLIVVDYKDYEATYFFAFALLLLSLGVLYALLSHRWKAVSSSKPAKDHP